MKKILLILVAVGVFAFSDAMACVATTLKESMICEEKARHKMDEAMARMEALYERQRQEDKAWKAQLQQEVLMHETRNELLSRQAYRNRNNGIWSTGCHRYSEECRLKLQSH